MFWQSVAAVRPDHHKGFNPWDRIQEPEALRALMRESGVDAPRVEAKAGEHPIGLPEGGWAAVMGSGYRGTIEQLAAADRVRVREENLGFIRRSGCIAVEENVLHATAKKGDEPDPGTGHNG